jgi:hypothetical protein
VHALWLSFAQLFDNYLKQVFKAHAGRRRVNGTPGILPSCRPLIRRLKVGASPRRDLLFPDYRQATMGGNQEKRRCCGGREYALGDLSPSRPAGGVKEKGIAARNQASHR